LLCLPAVAAGLILFASCTQQASSDRNSPTPTPTPSNIARVKADYSLKPTLLELSRFYEQETASKMQVSYALSLEIVPEAPGDSVDVYLLANDGYPAAPQNPDTLARVLLAYAVPCIVVPELNPALISDIKSLRAAGVRIGIADPGKDILGAFALEILKSNQLYDDLESRLIPIGPSALELAEAVARKDVDAAIGWTTFSNWTGGSTDIVLMNAAEIPRIAAICAWRAITPVDSANATKLLNFLKTDRAREYFRKWGYPILQADLEMYAPIAQIGGVPQN
jgi:molybdate transport system substrate-binding protein